MRIQLSDHFTYKKLIQFVIPSITSSIFSSIYSAVDGLFMTNFAGKVPFAAINLIVPYLTILSLVGFMLGTGGNALVAKTLGEGRKEKANEYFSLLVYVTIGLGILISVGGQLALKTVAGFLGARGDVLFYCVIYSRILLSALPIFMLQMLFQNFFVTAEKPKLGLYITVSSGVTNFILDFLFVVCFRWGIAGAAAATVAGELIGGLIPLIYFARKNDSLLRLVKTRIDLSFLKNVLFNGSSEMVTTISASTVAMLYNFQLMSYAGEDGIAAYGVVLYVNFFFGAIFTGYAMGSSPIVSFQYGAQNKEELQNVFRKSIHMILMTAFVLIGIAYVLSPILVGLFVGYDANLFEMTKKGFHIYMISFLMSGLNVYGSSLFTALGNGVVSAVISFLRTFVFQTSFVLIFPILFQLEGVWWALVAAEFCSLLVTVGFVVKHRERYGYY